MLIQYKTAMDGFRESLGNTDTANEIVDLWHEYEDAKTPEALFVKDLDKFEMIVQALEYEKCKMHVTENRDLSLIATWQPTRKSCKDSLIRQRASSNIPLSRHGPKHCTRRERMC